MRESSGCRLDSKTREWVPPRSTRYGMRRQKSPVPLTEDFMTTPRTRAIVSLTAALGMSLTSCVRPQPYTALDGRMPLQEASAHTVRFDNTANEHAHVYLVAEERQWLLGRVDPGARATLRIPDAAFAASTSRLQ